MPVHYADTDAYNYILLYLSLMNLLIRLYYVFVFISELWYLH